MILLDLVVSLNSRCLCLCLGFGVTEEAEIAHPEPAGRVVLENRLSWCGGLKLATATLSWWHLALGDRPHIAHFASRAFAYGDDLVNAWLVIANFGFGILYI